MKSLPLYIAAFVLLFAGTAHAQFRPTDDAQGAPGAASSTAKEPAKDPEACPVTGPRCLPQTAPEHPVTWRWPEFRTYQFVLTGIQLAATFGSQAIPGGGGRWTAKNDFDESARDALRSEGKEARARARDASDVGLIMLVNQRLVDDLFVTWWFYDRGDVAWQMALIDAQAISFTTAVAGLVSGIVGRRRPYVEEECARPARDLTSDCTGSKQFRSYFSGHTSVAFTLSGLTCMHHAYVPLYGGGFPEGLACAASMAAASTVGVMRVVSDQHYLSDVLTGAGVGLLSGLGIPFLFHYASPITPERSKSSTSAAAPSFTVVPSPNGMAVMGAF